MIGGGGPCSSNPGVEADSPSGPRGSRASSTASSLVGWAATFRGGPRGPRDVDVDGGGGAAGLEDGEDVDWVFDAPLGSMYGVGDG